MSKVISGIYALLDPNTEELRYVGCSRDINRRFINHCKIQTCVKYRATHLHHWLRSLDKKPKLIVLEETHDLEENETFYIGYFRALGCRLVNSTSGGEGVKGYKFSEEQKVMISEKTKIGMNKEVRQKLSDMKKGKPAKNKVRLKDQHGEIYESLTDVAKKLNCSPSAITYHLQNETDFVLGLTLQRI